MESSMETLTPEPPSEDKKEFNLNMELDDYETDSDLNSEECWDSEEENSAQKIEKKSNVTQNIGLQIVPFKNDEGIDVDSDEERSIMKEIRCEIENQVRADMKDELAIYQKKLQHLEAEASGETTQKEEPEEEMDPKLKAAILKMRKLDRILSKKMKREKEVKRERFFLQKRLREELTLIKPEGREDAREVKANMEKFLMLALPPSHNEGIDVENEPPITPVFHTQLNENEFEDRRQEQSNRNSKDPSARSSATSTRTTDSGDNAHDDEKLKNNQKKKQKKDFIMRNKQLASDADNPIPMTDDEKKRINDLLTDLDRIPEMAETESLESVSSNAWVSDNPFQMTLHTGEGYRPEPEEKMSLDRIDSQLKYLLPVEEITSLRSHSYSPDKLRLLSTRDIVSGGSEVEFDRLGEKALQEKRDERDLQTRLRLIEEELNRFKNPDEIELESPCLSEAALHNLIDQCVTSLSRSTLYTPSDGGNTPQSDCPSSRATILENPPKLEEDVLQKLLAEARNSIPSTRLATDSINDVRNHQFTKELGIEPISAETWNVILSHDASESDNTETPTSSDLFNKLASSGYHGHERSSSHLTEYEDDLYEQRTDTPLSIHSVRESDNFDDQSVRSSSSRQSNVPFLPEISQNPCLVSQGSQSNFVRPSPSTTPRTEINNGQFTDSRDFTRNSVPRPPTSERPQLNSHTRSVSSPSYQ